MLRGTMPLVIAPPVDPLADLDAATGAAWRCAEAAGLLPQGTDRYTGWAALDALARCHGIDDPDAATPAQWVAFGYRLWDLSAAAREDDDAE